MHSGQGTIIEIRSAYDGLISYKIDCAERLLPAPGQYLLAVEAGSFDSVLPVPLFRVDTVSQEIFKSPFATPISWRPGITLNLRGPLGKGFQLPSDTHHMALAACDETIARLLPLIDLVPDVDIAIFTSQPLPSLPLTVEAHPLSALPDALLWADFLAIDVNLERLETLRQTLALDERQPTPCLAQALIVSPMPCGALADCGVCAVPAKKGHLLTCKDGPVFDLNRLKW